MGTKCIKFFEQHEIIDLKALKTLLGKNDLRTLDLPLGPRMKMFSTIEERIEAMSEEQMMKDSQR